LNFGLFQFGIEPHVWLTDRFWAFAAAIGVSVWAHMGFFTLILLAGLQAIPKDLYEAAEMDGTKKSRVFWRITLPLLGPNLVVVIVLALIRAVQIFDEVYVLTGGGPGTSTLYLTQYIYQVGFASALRNPGLASAASILMGAVLVVLTLLQLLASRRNEQKGAR
jgi:alpha-1,4-digalacturonate transport system permease protein